MATPRNSEFVPVTRDFLDRNHSWTERYVSSRHPIITHPEFKPKPLRRANLDEPIATRLCRLKDGTRRLVKMPCTVFRKSGRVFLYEKWKFSHLGFTMLIVKDCDETIDPDLSAGMAGRIPHPFTHFKVWEYVMQQRVRGLWNAAFIRASEAT